MQNLGHLGVGGPFGGPAAVTLDLFHLSNVFERLEENAWLR
jgi:hypothetical protein